MAPGGYWCCSSPPIADCDVENIAAGGESAPVYNDPSQYVKSQKDRCYRDKFLLLIFVLVMIGSVVYPFIFRLFTAGGRWSFFLYGVDSFGNVCGTDNSYREVGAGMDMRGRKKLYYLDSSEVLTQGFKNLPFAKSVCVPSCPSDICQSGPGTSKANYNGSAAPGNCTNSQYQCAYYSQSSLSALGTSIVGGVVQFGPSDTNYSGFWQEMVEQFQVDEAGARDSCFPVVTASLDVLNRCLPDDGFLYSSSSAPAAPAGLEVLEDLMLHHLFDLGPFVAVLVLIGLLTSMLLTALWVYGMRFRPTFTSILTLIIVNLLNLAVCVLFIIQARSKEVEDVLDEYGIMDGIYLQQGVWRVIAVAVVIIWTLLTLVMSIIMFAFYFTTTKTCVQVASELCMPRIIFMQVPAVAWRAFLVIWGIFVTGMVYIGGEVTRIAGEGASPEEVEAMSEEECFWSPSCSYAVVAPGRMTMTLLQIWQLCAVLWCMTYSTGLVHTSVAGAVSRWYYSGGDPRHITQRYYPAVRAAATCQSGSIALGSLLHLAALPVAWLFRLADRQSRGLHSGNTGSQGCNRTCVRFSLSALLRYCNRNAYVMMAMTGDSFHTSAVSSASLISSHYREVKDMGAVGSRLIWYAKVSISMAVGTSMAVMHSLLLPWLPPPAYLYVRSSSPATTVLAVMLAAFVAADTMLQALDAAIDTLLLCCVQELEQNVEQVKLRFLPEKLKKIIREKLPPEEMQRLLQEREEVNRRAQEEVEIARQEAAQQVYDVQLQQQEVNRQAAQARENMAAAEAERERVQKKLDEERGHRRKLEEKNQLSLREKARHQKKERELIAKQEEAIAAQKHAELEKLRAEQEQLRLFKEFERREQERASRLEPIVRYPLTWTSTETHQAAVVPVGVDSQEFHQVAAKLCQDMPAAKVTQVGRVQNDILWKAYQGNLRHRHDRYTANGRRIFKDDDLVKQLWHGTSRTRPEVVALSAFGTERAYSNERCLWGAGNYFSATSNYSNSYAYAVCNSNLRQMILFDVITGVVFDSPPNNELKKPPKLPSNHEVLAKFGGGAPPSNLTYDSVTGVTKNARVYITYSSETAQQYPRYIITYDPSGNIA